MTDMRISEPMHRLVDHQAGKPDRPYAEMSVADTVSVIIPAYNAERYLDTAIDTALLQEGVQVEVLVIDDCSTDGTAELARRRSLLDDRVRVLHTPKNSGPAAARNRGLDAAVGEWIALLDADDRFQPGRLRRMLDFARQHDADIVSDNLLLCLETEGGVGTPMIPPARLHYPQGMSAADFILGNIGTRRHPRVSYGFMQPVIRRGFLVAANLRYGENNRFGEDFLLYVACLMQGARWWVMPEAMYLYTVRAGSLSEVQRPDDLLRIRTAEQQLLDTLSVRDDRALRNALQRHMAVIDRCFHYRCFTDAVKAGDLTAAGDVLFRSVGSFRDIVLASAVQAPTILSKAMRGGYRRQDGAGGRDQCPPSDQGEIRIQHDAGRRG